MADIADENIALQLEELEVLSEVYKSEIKVITTSHPIKYEMKITPLLEDDNFIHHYEYPCPSLTLHFILPSNYPLESLPRFYVESNTSSIFLGNGLSNVKALLSDFLAKVFINEPCVAELVEFARSWILDTIARKNKHFKKRKHRLNPDLEFGDEGVVEDEEIKMRPALVPVTKEQFDAWRIRFNHESRLKKLQDPNYAKTQATMKKKTGREIFDERSKDFNIYYMDDKDDKFDDDVEV